MKKRSAFLDINTILCVCGTLLLSWRFHISGGIAGDGLNMRPLPAEPPHAWLWVHSVCRAMRRWTNDRSRCRSQCGLRQSRSVSNRVRWFLAYNTLLIPEQVFRENPTPGISSSEENVSRFKDISSLLGLTTSPPAFVPRIASFTKQVIFSPQFLYFKRIFRFSFNLKII